LGNDDGCERVQNIVLAGSGKMEFAEAFAVSKDLEVHSVV